jgi:OOP family OmpA-OmpF porin
MYRQNKVAFVIAGLLIGTQAVAAEYNNLEDSWYMGGSLGISGLDPITSSGFQVTDDKDIGKKIYAGVNITDQVGLEAFWNDLGTAKISGSGVSGEARYRALGFNAVYKPPIKIGNVQPFGKVGAAKMSTKSSGNISITQENQFSLFGGVGADVELNKNLSMRTEFEYFTKDVNQLSIGVKWAPRGHIQKQKTVPAALPYNFGVQPTKVITRVIKQAPPKVELINKSLSGASSFASGSVVLTPQGMRNIDGIINHIRNSQIKVHHVKIVGHSDNVGRPRENLLLSQQRARSVANYFAQRGISRDAMSIVGVGDNQPVASNQTEQGRAQNRRVEIAVRGAKMFIK